MKRRFGISIDESIANTLEVLSHQTGVNRSKLIEEALKGYLEHHSHLLVPHTCKGILVARCPNRSLLAGVSEQYKEIIKAWLHAHLDGECMEAFFVEGDSAKIRDLYSSILKKGCSCRYVPAESLPQDRRSD